MAQNFLYMFEFVVDDLLVTRPNYCAPEEYPTCCEVSFRNSVFVSICDREFGNCIDPCATKCGKCCLFSLESPITDSDKLLVHVYKKKTDQCKFLLGCSDMPIKNLFDKVMESFDIENPKWQDNQARHISNIPDPSKPNKTNEIIDNDCDCEMEGRREQLCSTSELLKCMLPLFNLKNCQTGNVVLIIRLSANGPALVSTFPFARYCNAGCDKKPPNCNPKPIPPPCGNDKPCPSSCPPPCPPPDPCGKSNGERETAGCDSCGPSNGSKGGRSVPKKCGGSKQYNNFQVQNNGCMPMVDPCLKVVKKPVCRRYFACNADKGYPCDFVEDMCERAPKCNEQKQKLACCGQPPKPNPCSGTQSGFSQPQPCDCEECEDGCEAEKDPSDACIPSDPCKSSADTCDDCVQDPYSTCQCIQPCFVTPRRPDPGPDAYDEFEACLNGSGLVIRVLKDSHQVENICDGSEDFNDDNSSQSNQNCGKENYQTSQCSLANILPRSNFARNHIKRRTGGHIINHPDLPKIRANIKYSGNDSCPPDSYHVPYSKIKSFCDNNENKIDIYRTQRSKSNAGGAGQACTAKHRKNERNCCVQVNREDIRNMMKGIEVDTRKKGIEVCYKTCEDTDSDVFLVKLGSKQKCERKKNNIEIELKTPKQPLVLPKQHVTTETQINETELDAALSDACKKKGKGKGKKKK